MAKTPTPKSYLTPADRERIQKELKQLAARRKATSDVGVGEPQYIRPSEVAIDDSILAEREMRLRKQLQDESPPIVSGPQKNAAYREFRALVREFEENSLTKYDQGLGYPEIMKKSGLDHVADYERAKKKCLSWEMGSRGNYVGARLKELAGVLDPDNPELRNLENYRRGK